MDLLEDLVFLVFFFFVSGHDGFDDAFLILGKVAKVGHRRKRVRVGPTATATGRRRSLVRHVVMLRPTTGTGRRRACVLAAVLGYLTTHRHLNDHLKSMHNPSFDADGVRMKMS